MAFTLRRLGSPCRIPGVGDFLTRWDRGPHGGPMQQTAEVELPVEQRALAEEIVAREPDAWEIDG